MAQIGKHGKDQGKSGAPIDMKKFAGAAGTSIILVVALVMLFASLAGLLASEFSTGLAGGMQGDGGSSLPNLLILAPGLMVLASLALVVLSALTLLFDGSRPDWGRDRLERHDLRCLPTQVDRVPRCDRQWRRCPRDREPRIRRRAPVLRRARRRLE